MFSANVTVLYSTKEPYIWEFVLAPELLLSREADLFLFLFSSQNLKSKCCQQINLETETWCILNVHQAMHRTQGAIKWSSVNSWD